MAVALRKAAESFGTPVVGAHQVFCSDESEVECVDTFQSIFVEPLLPDLGPGKKAAFRTANLGARYEFGAARMAEHHYATPESQSAAKCVVIKVNGHVSEMMTPAGKRYGPMDRYQAESAACGALHALLAGKRTLFTDDLRQALNYDGTDRVAMLLDETGSSCATDTFWRRLPALGARPRVPPRIYRITSKPPRPST